MNRLFDNLWYSFLFYYLLFLIGTGEILASNWSDVARTTCAIFIGFTAICATAIQYRTDKQ